MGSKDKSEDDEKDTIFKRHFLFFLLISLLFYCDALDKRYIFGIKNQSKHSLMKSFKTDQRF